MKTTFVRTQPHDEHVRKKAVPRPGRPAFRVPRSGDFTCAGRTAIMCTCSGRSSDPNLNMLPHLFLDHPESAIVFHPVHSGPSAIKIPYTARIVSVVPFRDLIVPVAARRCVDLCAAIRRQRGWYPAQRGPRQEPFGCIAPLPRGRRARHSFAPVRSCRQETQKSMAEKSRATTARTERAHGMEAWPALVATQGGWHDLG